MGMSLEHLRFLHQHVDSQLEPWISVDRCGIGWTGLCQFGLIKNLMREAHRVKLLK